MAFKKQPLLRSSASRSLPDVSMNSKYLLIDQLINLDTHRHTHVIHQLMFALFHADDKNNADVLDVLLFQIAFPFHGGKVKSTASGFQLNPLRTDIDGSCFIESQCRSCPSSLNPTKEQPDIFGLNMFQNTLTLCTSSLSQVPNISYRTHEGKRTH